MPIVLIRDSNVVFLDPNRYLRGRMVTEAGIQACLVWEVLSSWTDDLLQEPGGDYRGLLEGMDAVDLLALVEQAQERLKVLGVKDNDQMGEPQQLYIDKEYNIRLGRKDGMDLPLRPLVKAVFIFFLKHPEGILLKDRGRYEEELDAIYEVIVPNVSPESRQERIRRLVNPEDNSFSEKASVLNARLEKLLPTGSADHYKIQGINGFPRRIPLDPLWVNWE